jgi:hypothetical protein
MFKCGKCGACCRNLDKSEIYAELDRGDGTCMFLSGTLCSIYERRPLICRVDECYEKYFKEIMTVEDYYAINKEVCKSLKKN